MHPAFSVIFLTTLIGVGQGFFLAMAAGESIAMTGAVPMPDDRGFFALGSVISLLFLIGGLVASFFHLGHPERAWRAATMWRTSWLSRECIALPACMALVALYGASHYFGWRTAPDPALHVAAIAVTVTAVVVCIALFICTGMIYVCIRFLQEWSSALTIVNFILLGCASGTTLAAAFAFLTAPQLVHGYAMAAICLTVLALVTRLASLYRNARLKPTSTLQTATGIRHPRIVQKSQGAMGGSFNTRHFFHGKSALFFRSVKWIFLLLVFPLPIVLLGGSLLAASLWILAGAFLLQYAGLIAERWFFFAQANHPQNLYYQRIS